MNRARRGFHAEQSSDGRLRHAAGENEQHASALHGCGDGRSVAAPPLLPGEPHQFAATLVESRHARAETQVYDQQVALDQRRRGESKEAFVHVEFFGDLPAPEQVPRRQVQALEHALCAERVHAVVVDCGAWRVVRSDS